MLKICVLVLTSFHLLCIKNAFSNHAQGLKSYCNGEMQSLFLIAMSQIPNFTIFAVIFCAKHTKNTPEFQLHCWSHVCKVNEWCLVDCFCHKFRDATQKWYLIIALWNVFCLWWAFNGALCHFSTTENISVNSNSDAANWSNKSWHNFCCTSSDLRSFLLGIWGILQTTKWQEINTFEWVHFYFLYPRSAHLHETGTGSLIVINLEYFVASRQWPFFFQLPSKDDRYGRNHTYNTKTNVCYFLWESTNIMLSALFADGIVRDYNLHMGGVDLSDMRKYIFLDERRTIWWNKKVFFTLFGRLLLNSFIFYQCNSDLPKFGRQKFMVKVVEGLIGGFKEQCNRP